MSVAMISRISGMILQYTDRTIDRGCISVVDGMLLQRPFSRDCLDACDWIVLIFTGTSFAFTFVGLVNLTMIFIRSSVSSL